VLDANWSFVTLEVLRVHKQVNVKKRRGSQVRQIADILVICEEV
jgi:hypothetical protein